MPLYRKRSRSSLKRRSSRTGRYSRYRRTKTLRSRVTQILNKKTETKYFDIGAENLQLYHNLGQGVSGLPPTSVTSLPLFFNPWINILNGTNRQSRIGDKILPRGMSIKLYLAAKTDRPNTMFRVIVAILPKVMNGVLTTSIFDPFQIANQGNLGNTMLYPPDTDKGVKFLYDKIHQVGPNEPAIFTTTGGSKERTKILKLWIKRKKAGNIVYDTTSSTIVNRPLALYVIPYEQYSTLTTDNIASCACFMRMYFKDI